MTNYWTEYSFSVDGVTAEERQWFLEKKIRDAGPDVDGNLYYSTLPSFVFEPIGEDYLLWIYSDGSDSDEMDVLAELLQDFLREFRPDQHIAFSWANTCSKPRVDAFGGGAAFITAESISWMSTWDWIIFQGVGE